MNPMNTRRSFLFQALSLAGVTFLSAGCGSDSGTMPLPAPSQAPPEETPAETPPAVSGAGDFAFVAPISSDILAFTTVILDASGSGSRALTLRSVRGFNAPITFPIDSVTARDPRGATLAAGGITARFSPESLPTLPPGDTAVALQVQGASSLPSASEVVVEFHALGSGLSRYLLSNPDRNTSAIRFYVPGVALIPGEITLPLGQNARPGSAGISVRAAGLTGELQITLTDLPAGVTASTETISLTATSIRSGAFTSLTLQRTGNVAPGSYPVRVVATRNGAVVQTEAATLTTVGEPEPLPILNYNYAGPINVTRGQPTRVPIDLTLTRRSGTVSFSVRSLPPGVTVTFDNPSINFIADQKVTTFFTYAADVTAASGEQRVELLAKFGEFEYPLRIPITVAPLERV